MATNVRNIGDRRGAKPHVNGTGVRELRLVVPDGLLHPRAQHALWRPCEVFTNSTKTADPARAGGDRCSDDSSVPLADICLRLERSDRPIDQTHVREPVEDLTRPRER